MIVHDTFVFGALYSTFKANRHVDSPFLYAIIIAARQKLGAW